MPRCTNNVAMTEGTPRAVCKDWIASLAGMAAAFQCKLVLLSMQTHNKFSFDYFPFKMIDSFP